MGSLSSRGFSGLLLCASLLLSASSPTQAASEPEWAATAPNARIVVAISDRPDPVISVGGSPRAYGGIADYSGSKGAGVIASQLAQEFELREIAVWTIEVLRLRCMVYELVRGEDAPQTLARVAADPRVRIAQPLHEFETLSDDAAGSYTSTDAVIAYNDPYFGLQRNLEATGVGEAHRWGSGKGVTVAVVDTGLDAQHGDLTGRIRNQVDFVSAAGAPQVVERHATQVAGVIAAVANNALGIIGVAPQTQLSSYRACWSVDEESSRARCNSYTLALALAEAIASDARIINLSLGGPRDPLLEELVTHAVAKGRIVVAARPFDRPHLAFPAAVPGVLAVSESEQTMPLGEDVLAAPGRDVLTLAPSGHFDYASGSSLAAAQVSGAVALLLSINRKLDAQAVARLLKDSQSMPGAPINACHAARAAIGDKNGSCTVRKRRS
jgi:subtilisin family serine protease